MSQVRNLCLCAIMFLLIPVLARGATIIVDPNGEGDFTTIQAAISNAYDFDEVVVYPGVYEETIVFFGKSITVRSLNPNDWDIVEDTVITTVLSPVAVFCFGEDANSVLNGFTLNGIYDSGIECSGVVTPTISHCIISNCSRGIYCANGGSPTINNCIIKNNSNTGIITYYNDCNPVIENCLIYANGGGINGVASGSLNVSNCSIVSNTSYGISNTGAATDTITNCILWDNNDDLSGCSATFSCIEDGDAGTGNISIDPNFLDAANGDYHLSYLSPCIEAGDPNGNYTSQSDIDGEDRVMGSNVDMGADEALYPFVIYVDCDATGDNDGSTWANAFTDLKNALNAADTDNQIWVAAGTYKPGTSRSAKFTLVDGVEIYGGFDPNSGDDTWAERDYVNNETILSGNIGNTSIATDNCYHVVYGPDSVTAILDGFTVSGGYANGSSSPSYIGGGIYMGYSIGSVIRNCIIEDNFSKNQGGGIYLGNSYEQGTVISHCYIINNKCKSNWGGAGLYSNFGCTNIDHCVISGNEVDTEWDTGGGGGMTLVGDEATSTISDCIFESNITDGDAGALEIGVFTTNRVFKLDVKNCIFANNSSVNIGGAIFNHANFDSPEDLAFTNCVFTGNTTGDDGGALYNYCSSPTITNCTFINNSCTYGPSFSQGGAIYNRYHSSYGPSEPLVTNCIFWNNTSAGEGDEIYNDTYCHPTFKYCDIRGGLNGIYCGGANSVNGGGNINADPNFVAPTDPDGYDDVWLTADDGLMLNAISPCIDAANGYYDPDADILGNGRYDDPNTINTGTGDPNYVDMGIYEFQR